MLEWLFIGKHFLLEITCCIKSKEGKLIIEQEKIHQIESEYIEELFHNEKEKPAMHKNIEQSEMLRSEVKLVLDKMNSNETEGPDMIAIEMLSVWDNSIISKITEIIKYTSGDIPEYHSRSIFVALPVPDTNECKLHQSISLMNHINKLIIWILMNKAQSWIRPEIRWQRFYFGLKTGTENIKLVKK